MPSGAQTAAIAGLRVIGAFWSTPGGWGTGTQTVNQGATVLVRGTNASRYPVASAVLEFRHNGALVAHVKFPWHGTATAKVNSIGLSNVVLISSGASGSLPKGGYGVTLKATLTTPTGKVARTSARLGLIVR